MRTSRSDQEHACRSARRARPHETPPRDVDGRDRARHRRRPAAAHARGRGPGPRRRTRIARAAAKQAAVLSGSLALPPGPFGHADRAARPLPHLEDAAADGGRHLRAVRPHGRADAHAHALLPVPPRGEPGAARRRGAHGPARRRVSSCAGGALQAVASQGRRLGEQARRRATPRRAGCRSRAPPRSAPMRTGTRCRWRRPRGACSPIPSLDAPDAQRGR